MRNTVSARQHLALLEKYDKLTVKHDKLVSAAHSWRAIILGNSQGGGGGGSGDHRCNMRRQGNGSGDYRGKMKRLGKGSGDTVSARQHLALQEKYDRIVVAMNRELRQWPRRASNTMSEGDNYAE